LESSVIQFQKKVIQFPKNNAIWSATFLYSAISLSIESISAPASLVEGQPTLGGPEEASFSMELMVDK
jgi:hypothetical protein